MSRKCADPVPIMTSVQFTTMNFTFEELDAILALIEMHDWCMLSEHLDVDISLLYDKVSELRDEVA